VRRILALLLLLAVAAATACDREERPPAAAPLPETSAAERPTGIVYLRHLRSPSITWIDLASGDVATVSLPELAPGDPPHSMVRVGEKLVVYGGGRTYALDPELENPPLDLGESWYFIPSATAGRVWLMTLDPESPETVRDLAAVREVSVDGRLTLAGSARPPSRGPSILAAVESGLLYQDGDGLSLWNPATGEVLRRLGGQVPTATHEDLVAWCAAECPELHLTNTATGEDAVVRTGGSFAFAETYDGAFSPDGSLLAVPVVTSGGQRVALVDVRQAAGRVVPGSELSSDYPALAWTPSGDWLLWSAGGGRLMAAQPDGEAIMLGVRAPATFLDMAAG
jgi:hypothetical protein